MKTAMLAAAGMAAIFQAATAAQAAPVVCAIAGDYQGQYDGPNDRGFLRVSVASGDGALTGKAQSAVTGEVFAVGGVLNADGTLAAGSATASGAQLTGRFVPNVGSGNWSKLVPYSDGTQRTLTGSWGVERIADDDDCQ
ncbi:hypothetical protein [Paraburkholderia acidisoli]|uniref:Uncharacterized protein n=1 Tax=Paraburkholderia acidisoli TaxID=2571748 RepID=A0A7Z2GP26_9BURK|nr:hypothetical protein [Paraburkholderia acidisoli]QGZ65141.1 hypothetical protein FAZ98_25530 [Paraburkholderia acidisoli]